MTIPAPARTRRLTKRQQSFLLVFSCTVVGAFAQLLIKSGATHVTHPGFLAALIAMFTNPPLFFGYCMYGFNMVLLVLALRDCELSMLYPIIALTFIWVTVLSMIVFHDHMNVYKGVGIGLIVLGVGVLGRGGAS